MPIPPRAVALALILAAAGASAQLLTVESVARSDWRPVFGAVQSVERAEARVRIAGTLTAVAVDEGDAVTAGQKLAEVVDDKIALQLAALDASLAALDAQMAQAGIDLARAEELRTRGAAPAAALDAARTARDVITQTRAARAAERAALAARQAEGAVLAPASGRVLSAPLAEGVAVQPGETVAVIAVADFVLRALLPERHARFLREGETVRIAARGALSDGGAAAEGRIAKVYPELRAGQVVVDVAAEGLGDFFVGERIRLEVATGRRDAIVVPDRYLDRRHGVTFARLQDGGEVVVQPGAAGSDGVEILSGLRAGDVLTPYRD